MGGYKKGLSPLSFFYKGAVEREILTIPFNSLTKYFAQMTLMISVSMKR